MLKDIHIQNYRGIKDLKIKDFKRINLLVGDNNSGKTSVLEAALLLAYPRNPINLIESDNYRTLDLTEGVEVNAINLQLNFLNDNFLWEKLRFFCFNKEISNQISISTGDERLEISFDLKTNNFGENTKSINLNPNYDANLPQSVVFKYSKNSEDTGFSVGPILKFSPEQNKTIGDRVSFMRFQKRRSRDLASNLSKFLKEGKGSENEHKILQVLKQIEPKISVIIPDSEKIKNPSIAVKVDGIQGAISLDYFGDGIINVLAQVLEIYHSRNSVVLIDEIENGLHWKTQKVLWKALITAAEENNVQIIATTHSCDAINALSEVCEENFDKDQICLFRILKDSEGANKALRFNFEMIKHATTTDTEVR